MIRAYGRVQLGFFMEGMNLARVLGLLAWSARSRQARVWLLVRFLVRDLNEMEGKGKGKGKVRLGTGGFW